jgi:hypothetical protein
MSYSAKYRIFCGRHTCHTARVHMPGRITAQHGAKAVAAIGGDRRQPSDVAQGGLHLAVLQPETDAGKEHAVEKSFQDGRIAEVPHREHQHQRLGRTQPFHIPRHRPLVRPHLVVPAPFLCRQHRLEAFGVKVTVVHLPAALLQGMDHNPMQRLRKTFVAGMRGQNHRPHQGALMPA